MSSPRGEGGTTSRVAESAAAANFVYTGLRIPKLIGTTTAATQHSAGNKDTAWCEAEAKRAELCRNKKEYQRTHARRAPSTKLKIPRLGEVQKSKP